LGNYTNDNYDQQKCFNGRNNYQMKWFDDDRYVELLSSAEANITMVGAVDVTEAVLGDKVVVKIAGKLKDYFISFNVAKGGNFGTEEGQNVIVIHEAIAEDFSKPSLIHILPLGTSVSLENQEITFTRISVESEIDKATLTITFTPSEIPSDKPSDVPSSSTLPSTHPSAPPSGSPSSSSLPSTYPAAAPSAIPTVDPVPSETPSETPSDKPSDAPSVIPTLEPSTMPSTSPSEEPSSHPSAPPSAIPSVHPSNVPSETPSNHPSISLIPSRNPSALPSISSAPSSEVTVPSSSPSKNFNVSPFTPRNVVVLSINDETVMRMSALNSTVFDSLNTQLQTCSSNQLSLSHHSGSTGVLFIDLGYDPDAKDFNEVVEDAKEKFLQHPNQPESYDHLMFCIPDGVRKNGSDDWGATATDNGKESYFNAKDGGCTDFTDQMKMIGSNLGLGPSESDMSGVVS
jgi:hypothetical protein